MKSTGGPMLRSIIFSVTACHAADEGRVFSDTQVRAYQFFASFSQVHFSYQSQQRLLQRKHLRVSLAPCDGCSTRGILSTRGMRITYAPVSHPVDRADVMHQFRVQAFAQSSSSRDSRSHRSQTRVATGVYHRSEHCIALVINEGPLYAIPVAQS